MKFIVPAGHPGPLQKDVMLARAKEKERKEQIMKELYDKEKEREKQMKEQYEKEKQEKGKETGEGGITVNAPVDGITVNNA